MTKNLLSKIKILPKGFTLVELLVVIAVLGVLATGILVAINPLKKIKQANDAKIQNDIGVMGRAAQSYYVLHSGVYPTLLADLVTYGEVKRLPNPPVSGSYGFNASGGDVSISFPVQDSSSGIYWCWSSATGKITSNLVGACNASGGSSGTSAFTPIGNNDVMTCASFAGWTCDKDVPSQATKVYFYEGVSPSSFTSVVASNTREVGVGTACNDGSNHGFSFPPGLSSGSHSITVKVDDIDNLGNIVGSPAQGGPFSLICL